MNRKYYQYHEKSIDLIDRMKSYRVLHQIYSLYFNRKYIDRKLKQISEDFQVKNLHR